MNYKIGFPIDGGDAKSSAIVLVNLRLAIHHYCKGGQSSGLREASGAAFVFCRLSSYVRNRYRLEFDVQPFISDQIAPDNIADTGYSDAVACAVAALVNQGKNLPDDAPTIMISMSFTDNRKEEGFNNIYLEKVTSEDRETSRESLRNKWEVCKNNNALALVLHEDDAKLLSSYDDIDVLPLNRNVFAKLSQTKVVSCRREDWPLLLKLLRSSHKKNVWKKLLIAMLTILMVFIFIPKSKNYKEVPLDKSLVDISEVVISPQKYQLKVEVQSNLFVYILTPEKDQSRNLIEIFPYPHFEWGTKISPGVYILPSDNDYFKSIYSHPKLIFVIYSDHPLSGNHHNYLQMIGTVPRDPNDTLFLFAEDVYLLKKLFINKKN